MPGLVGGFGNYFLPIHAGSPDMANIFSKYLYCLVHLKKYQYIYNIRKVNKCDNFNLKKTSSAPVLKKIEFNLLNSIFFRGAGAKSKNEIDTNLGYYLAGLIEGDGYISITNQNRIILGITFNIKDKPLAEKLLSYIGKGFIAKRKTNSVELRFSAKDSIYTIIQLVNGKFRTPKIDQLHCLIDWMNKNHIQSTNLKIKKLSIDNSDLSNNCWLAGFIDADGNFYIRNALKQKICKFSLEQRMVYPKTQESYKDILEKITIFLNVKLHIRSRPNYNNSYYIIKVENQNSLNILINYLDNYSLLSSKYLDFLDWKKAFLIILNKNHFSEDGANLISSYKNNMNDKRTFFNWTHLNF